MNKLVLIDKNKAKHVLETSEKLNENWFKLFKYENYDNINMKLSIDKSEAILNIFDSNNKDLNSIEKKLHTSNDGILEFELEDLFIDKNISLEEFDQYVKDMIEKNIIVSEQVFERQTATVDRDEYFKQKKKKNLAKYGSNTVTKIIIGINIAVFIIYQLNLLPLKYIMHGYTPLLGFTITSIISIFVSGFLQWSILHLFFNMSFLFYIGSDIEKLIGKVKFLIVYLLLMFVSGLCVIFLTPPTTVIAGASGALFGLLGFAITYLWVKHMGFSELRSTGLIGILIINIIFTFAYPDISIIGHISGLLFGLLLGLIFAKLNKNN